MLIMIKVKIKMNQRPTCKAKHYKTLRGKHRIVFNIKHINTFFDPPPKVMKVSVAVLVQQLNHVQLFATPWTAVYLTSLSFTISKSLLKFMSIELVRPSNLLILCLPLLLLLSIFPSIRVFSISQLFASVGQSTGTSASVSVLPTNIQD